MSENFYGAYRCTIDSNRIRVPARFKNGIGTSPSILPAEGHEFLHLVPAENMDEMLGYLFPKHLYEQKDSVAERRRKFSTQIIPVEVDSQGRLSLSAKAKGACPKICGGVEVVFLGAGKYIEIWPAVEYDRKYKEQMNDDELGSLIESLRATLESLG